VTLEIPYEEYDRPDRQGRPCGSITTVSDIGMIFPERHRRHAGQNVRQAAVMSIDKKLLVDRLLRGYGLPIDTLETPNMRATIPPSRSSTIRKRRSSFWKAPAIRPTNR